MRCVRESPAEGLLVKDLVAPGIRVANDSGTQWGGGGGLSPECHLHGVQEALSRKKDNTAG